MYRKISKHLIAFLALLLCACIKVSAGNTVTIPTSKDVKSRMTERMSAAPAKAQ